MFKAKVVRTIHFLYKLLKNLTKLEKDHLHLVEELIAMFSLVSERVKEKLLAAELALAQI